MKRGAAIINTGPIAGLEASGNLPDYSVKTGAIHAFRRALARNLVDREIRVNCVAPGPVWIPLEPLARPAGEEVAEHGADQPMGWPAQPEEVAAAFAFFRVGG